jgi:uncharacterized protein YdaL
MSQPTPDNEFETIAAKQSDASLAAEFFDFLRHNKKWWLLPIVAILLLLGVLIFLSTTAAAPFIYTLF